MQCLDIKEIGTQKTVPAYYTYRYSKIPLIALNHFSLFGWSGSTHLERFTHKLRIRDKVIK